MLLNDHDFYEGNLKTTGKLTNCVLSFNVQGSVYTVLIRKDYCQCLVSIVCPGEITRRREVIFDSENGQNFPNRA